MLKKIQLAIFGILFFIPSVFFAGTTSITLSPIETKIFGKPGTTNSQEAYIFNQGDSPFLLTCSFGDFWHENGKSINAPLGSIKERQAGAWLQCSPNRKLIPAKSKEKIQILAAIPKDAQGDHFATIYAEMRSPNELKVNPGQSSLQAVGRIAGVVIVRPTSTEKIDPEIIDAKITREKKFQVFTAKLKNNGNIFLRGEGTLVFTDSNLNTTYKASVLVPFTLPGVTKEITTNLIQQLPSGSYQAVLSITDNKGISFVKEFKVNAP